MPRLCALILVVMVVAGCGAAPHAQTGSGIQGTVEAGPTCPVERLNSPCPPHPLAATVVVSDSRGAEVTRFHSGPDGRFKVDLSPGNYTLVGQPIGASMLPRPIPTTVTVVLGSYATVNVEYDSGIR
jgi:hypothetical protein